MYYVYVLRDKEGKLYVGRTENLSRRVKEHEGGRVHTTARFDESALIYYECFVSEKDATRREDYLKTTKGKQGLKLILRDTLN